jgi:hypothetical protein
LGSGFLLPAGAFSDLKNLLNKSGFTAFVGLGLGLGLYYISEKFGLNVVKSPRPSPKVGLGLRPNPPLLNMNSLHTLHRVRSGLITYFSVGQDRAFYGPGGC